jgi:hypothetical protein
MTKKEHQASAEHDVTLAKLFGKLADSHGEVADSMDTDNPSGAAAQRSCGETCKAISDEHVQSAQRHVDACAKSADDEIEKSESEGTELRKLLDGVHALLQRTEPSSVSAIPLHDTRRIIPRAGQPTAEDREKAEKALAPELHNVLIGTQAAT